MALSMVRVGERGGSRGFQCYKEGRLGAPHPANTVCGKLRLGPQSNCGGLVLLGAPRDEINVLNLRKYLYRVGILSKFVVLLGCGRNS